MTSTTRLLPLLTALALAAASFCASAETTRPAEPVGLPATTAEIYNDQKAVRELIDRKSGPFTGLQEVDRQALYAQQAKIVGMLQSKQTTAEMDEPSREALRKALVDLRALMAKADDNRLICERVRAMGSNRPKSKCMTVADRRAANRNAEDQAIEERSHDSEGKDFQN